MFSRHPVDNRVISQPWGANKTGGVTANQHGTPVQQLVFYYGNYQSQGHDGIDYACPVGTPVHASGAGIIEYAGWGQSMPQHIAAKYGFAYGAAGWASGIIVCIDHGGNLGSYSAHMSEWHVNAGQHVGANTVVGLSGNTGRSGGPHVHWSAIRFPVNYSDPLYSRVNPLDYFTVVTNTPIIPGATGGTNQPSKELFTVGQYEDLTNLVKSALSEATNAKVAAARALDIVTENQQRINRIPEAILDATYPLEGSEKGKRSNVRNRFAWLPHEQHRVANDVLDVQKQLREVLELLYTQNETAAPKEEVAP